jgi:hypothetical protein
LLSGECIRGIGVAGRWHLTVCGVNDFVGLRCVYRPDLQVAWNSFICLHNDFTRYWLG